MKFPIKKVRKNFPVFKKISEEKPFVYFDTAATSHKTSSVIESLYSFYSKDYATVHRAIYQRSLLATDQYDATRKAAAKFLNAKSDEEIIFTKGTTEGINLVAYSFGQLLKRGDEILISETEHHSNIVPWQLLCERSGCILKIIPVNDKAELILGSLDTLLSDKTKIVSVAHISNATGTCHAIETVIQRAHQVGAVVLIDGAQSAGHLSIDVQKLDADFYAFSGHKIYGPNGVGILYGKKELLEKMPPFLGGGDMIDHVCFAKTTYREAPLKFEAGTPAIAEIIALKESFDFIESLGRKNIDEWEHNLLKKATTSLQELPEVTIIGTADKKGPIISFVVQGAHPMDIGTFLDLKGICLRTGHHCAHPTMERFQIEATARISFGVYNTPEEVDYFIQSLKEVIFKIKNSPSCKF